MNTTGTKEKNPERNISAPSTGPSDHEKATPRQQQMQIPHDDKQPPSLPPPSRTKHAGKRTRHRHRWPRRRTGVAAEAVTPGPPPAPPPTTIAAATLFSWLVCFTFPSSCRVSPPLSDPFFLPDAIAAPASSVAACHRRGDSIGVTDRLWRSLSCCLRPSDLDRALIASCFKVRAGK